MVSVTIDRDQDWINHLVIVRGDDHDADLSDDTGEEDNDDFNDGKDEAYYSTLFVYDFVP